MMPVLTFGELNIFVTASLFFGVLLGAVYDLFRIFRFFIGAKKKRDKKDKKGLIAVSLFHVLQFFLDFLFCLICTAAAVALFSSYGKGQARIISIIAMALGFLLWNKTIGRLAYPFAALLKRFLICAFGFIYRHTLAHLLNFANKAYRKTKNKLTDKQMKKYDREQKEKVSRFIKGEEKLSEKKGKS